MKRTNIIIFLISILFLCFTQKVSAQTDDSIAQRIGTINSGTVADTSLQRIFIDNEGDSIAYFKSDKSFAYVHYLDSLLRLQKDLSVDTFSIDKTKRTAGIKRKKPSTSSTEKSSINFLNNFFVKIILWAIAIFFIGFILYKLFLTGILFRKRPVKKQEVLQKTEEDLTDPLAYNKLILQASADKNYRLAIRYLFLQTLQMLSGKGFIQLSPDKTNYQYITEISNTIYQKDFSSITLNYEYTWYGKFAISEEVYNKLYLKFRSFQQTI